MTFSFILRIFTYEKREKTMKTKFKYLDYGDAMDNLLDGINNDYVGWTSGWDDPTKSRENFKEGLSVKSGR